MGGEVGKGVGCRGGGGVVFWVVCNGKGENRGGGKETPRPSVGCLTKGCRKKKRGGKCKKKEKKKIAEGGPGGGTRVFQRGNIRGGGAVPDQKSKSQKGKGGGKKQAKKGVFLKILNNWGGGGFCKQNN